MKLLLTISLIFSPIVQAETGGGEAPNIGYCQDAIDEAWNSGCVKARQAIESQYANGNVEAEEFCNNQLPAITDQCDGKTEAGSTDVDDCLNGNCNPTPQDDNVADLRNCVDDEVYRPQSGGSGRKSGGFFKSTFGQSLLGGLFGGLVGGFLGSRLGGRNGGGGGPGYPYPGFPPPYRPFPPYGTPMWPPPVAGPMMPPMMNMPPILPYQYPFSGWNPGYGGGGVNPWPTSPGWPGGGGGGGWPGSGGGAPGVIGFPGGGGSGFPNWTSGGYDIFNGSVYPSGGGYNPYAPPILPMPQSPQPIPY